MAKRGNRLCTKLKFRWIDFLRSAGGYWPHPRSIDQAMAIYQWLIASASEDNGPSDKYPDTYALLSCSSGVSHREVDPLVDGWKGALERRFHNILIPGFQSEGARRWRKAVGLDELHRERWLHVRYRENAYGCDDADEIFKMLGRRLARPHNSYHPGAREICTVELFVQPRGYTFKLCYAYSGWDPASWSVGASSNPGEPFCDFATRARKKLEALMVPLPGEAWQHRYQSERLAQEMRNKARLATALPSPRSWTCELLRQREAVIDRLAQLGAQETLPNELWGTLADLLGCRVQPEPEEAPAPEETAADVH